MYKTKWDKKGSIVYDPFVGTGTTVVEALKLGMIGIGTDIDEDFIKFSKKRVLYKESPSLKNETTLIKNKQIKNPSKQMSLGIV